jgi:hypothetical protein
MVHNRDQELEELAAQTSVALQEIQNRLGRAKNPAGAVRFPRGFLRTASQQRQILPELGTGLQRHNASYGLMMADVLRWLAIRTDISGPALSMMVKEAICIYGTISDWLTKEATRGHGSRRPFAYRAAKLVEIGVIDPNLQAEIDWVWEVRCNEHFHEVNGLEHERYSRTDHDRAWKAFVALCKALK